MIRINQKLMENGSLYSVLNGHLVEELRGYFAGQDSQWASEHGFRYPGEALERFEERRAYKSQEDLRAFVLAAVMTAHWSYDFNGTQKENFSQVVKNTEGYGNDGILQLLTSAWELQVEQSEGLDACFISSLQTQDERIVALHLLNHLTIIEFYPNVAIELLSQLEISLLNDKEVHDRLEPIKVLVEAYENTRFKKSDCKEFLPIYDFMLHAWRLAKKELKTDVLGNHSSDLLSYQKAMKLTDVEVLTIHHLLVHWDKTWGNVSQVAKERIFTEYVRVHLTQENEVTEAFKEEVNHLVKTNQVYKVYDIGRWLARISNDKNLEFVKDLSNDFLQIAVTFSSLSMLDHPLFNRESAERFINGCISSEYFNDLMRLKAMKASSTFTRFEENPIQKTWELVEKKRREWNIYRNAGSAYLTYLFEIGLYQKDDYRTIKEVNLTAPYHSFVKSLKTKDREQYLHYLSIIPVEDRDFLGESVGHYYYTSQRVQEKKFFDANFSKEIANKELYVSLLLETILYHEPAFYADELYRMIQSDVFEEIGATEEELNGLLQICHKQQLFFDEAIARGIKEQFMSEEEKLERDKNVMIKQLEQCSNTYDFKRYFKTVPPYLIFEEVREALLNTFLALEMRYSGDLPDIFHWLTKEKINQTIPSEMVEKMFDKLNLLIIEKEKIDRKELEYRLYAYKVLEKNKKENEKKENDACLA